MKMKFANHLLPTVFPAFLLVCCFSVGYSFNDPSPDQEHRHLPETSNQSGGLMRKRRYQQSPSDLKSLKDVGAVEKTELSTIPILAEDDEEFLLLRLLIEAENMASLNLSLPSASPSINNVPLSSPFPSRAPSTIPSAIPSSEPSVDGFINPSAEPSVSSAPTPTDQSQGPSAIPSRSPIKPSPSPTEYPNANPVFQPPATSKPTRSPTELYICMDDPVYFYNKPSRTCAFIDEKDERRRLFCQNFSPIEAACPRTCGQCCFNNNDFRFEVNGKAKKCNWMQRDPKRPARWCSREVPGGRKISDYCPKACSICRFQDPTPSPTSAPVTILPTPDFCENDETWHWYDFPKGTCKWVRNKEHRRKKFCQKEYVYKNCPQACGLCCTNNPKYNFEHNGELRNCAWVGEFPYRQKLFCDSFQNGEMVRDMCPVSCDKCLDPI